MTVNLLQNISVVLLAGGKSRRMGQHKALLPLDGQPLLGRVIQQVRSLGAEDILIAGSPEPDLYDFGVRVVEDRVAGQGPLAGIEVGLAGAQHESVLVLPCDMAAVPFEVVARLVGSKTDCSVAKDERLQPLYGIYPKRAAELAHDLLVKEQLRMKGLVDALNAEVIDCSDLADAFTNLNTPQDYEAALRRETNK